MLTREELEQLLAQYDEAQTEEQPTEETTEETTEEQPTEETKLSDVLELVKVVMSENNELKEALNKYFKTSPTDNAKVTPPVTSTETDINKIVKDFITRDGSYVNRYLKEHGIEKENK